MTGFWQAQLRQPVSNERSLPSLHNRASGDRAKKPSTIVTDTGHIERHIIIPLLRTRRAKDLTKADINKVFKNIMAGKTRVLINRAERCGPDKPRKTNRYYRRFLRLVT